METSLMVDDYPTQEESKTYTTTFDVYVKLTFTDVELEEGYTPKDYINDNGINDYDDYEIESIEE